MACWLLSYSTIKDLCKTRGLKMTVELQSNIASKITLNLVFFKCSPAKNDGVKLEVSSHFSALGSQMNRNSHAEMFNPAFHSALSLFLHLFVARTYVFLPQNPEARD